MSRLVPVSMSEALQPFVDVSEDITPVRGLQTISQTDINIFQSTSPQLPVMRLLTVRSHVQ
jgi:hypothetical protein